MYFRRVFVVLVAVVFASGFAVYYYDLPDYLTVKTLRDVLSRALKRRRFVNPTLRLRNANDATKYVLFWTTTNTSSGDGNFRYKFGGFQLFQSCEFRNCYATSDRSFLPPEKFDSLLFDAADYNGGVHGTPESRDVRHRYVFVNSEPPVRQRSELGHYGNFYNWTMTYRSDSDIYRPFGRVIRRRTRYELPSADVVRKRSGMVAWIAKKCITRSRRESYVRELRKFVNVDVGGKCDYGLFRNETVFGYDTLEKYYKFYLSFEDSLCGEYVTAELYDVLKLNVIPIVYGGMDYGRCAPPYSVINIGSFRSPGNLAMYLLHLDENVEEYLKYFHWKRDFIVETRDDYSACTLCKKLHDSSESNRVYSNIREWWKGKNNSMCQS